MPDGLYFISNILEYVKPQYREKSKTEQLLSPSFSKSRESQRKLLNRCF